MTAKIVKTTLDIIAGLLAIIGALQSQIDILAPLFTYLHLDIKTCLGIAIAIKTVGSIIGDWLDNGKPDGSFGRTVAILLFLGLCLGTGGCALSDQRKAQLQATIAYAGQKTAQVALNVVLNAAVSQLDADHKQDIASGLSTALRQQEGNLVTGDDIMALYGIWTPAKPHWKDSLQVIAEEVDRARSLPAKDRAKLLESIAAELEKPAPTQVRAEPRVIGWNGNAIARAN